MRTCLAGLLAALTLIASATDAAAQVVPDGRTGEVPRRHFVTVRVPAAPVLSALERGNASSIRRLAAGKRDSLVFSIEKPMPRSWRRPRRQVEVDERLHIPVGPSPFAKPTVVRASGTAAWVDDLIEGPAYADVAFENGAFLIPPDPFVAAGPDHVVAVVNTSIATYAKDGTLVWRQAMGQFFGALDPQGTLFDPRIRYDAFDGRFVATILELVDDGPESRRSSVLVGISDGPDAAGGWTTLRLDTAVPVDSVAHWADYPGIALDDEALYLTANLYSFVTGNYGGTRIWVADKAALYAGSDSSFVVLDPFAAVDLPELASTLQPAEVVPPAPPDSTGTWFLEYSGLTDGESEYMAAYRVSDPLGSPSVDAAFFEFGPIDDLTIALPTAPQPDTSIPIETNDRRMLDAVMRDGRVVASMTVSPRSGPDVGQATAIVVDVDVADPLSPALTAVGLIGGEELGPGTSTYFPSVAIGPDGALLVGISVSSPTLYGSAAAVGRLADDPVGWLSPPTLVRQGDGPYVRQFDTGLNRWGDYSGVASDPADGSFWLFNEYAGTPGNELFGEDGQWATVLAHMAVDRRNTPPVALDAWVEAVEDTPTGFELQAFDADDDVPTFSLVDGPYHGTAVLDSAHVTYEPAADYWGPDSLRFAVVDDQARSDTARVRIQVLPVNDPPVAVDDSLQTLEDVPLVASVAANDTDVDGDALSFEVIVPVDVGLLAFDADGSFTYTPLVDFGGEASFGYRATDPSGAADEADVHITVVPLNDPPVAYPLVVVAYRDQPILLPFNGSDPDGPKPDFEVVALPAHGELFTGEHGLFYRAETGYVGQDSLRYRAFDGEDYSSPALVRIFVISNRRPDAVADRYTVAEGDSIVVGRAEGLLANDSDLDGDTLSAVLVEAPELGVLHLAPDGSFTYSHDGSETTGDGFRYAAVDPDGLRHEAQVTIDVVPVNDAPVALGDTLRTGSETAAFVILAGMDAEGDALSFRIAEPPVHGAASVAGDTLWYGPAPGFAGADSVRFVADDGARESEPATIVVRVDGLARLQMLHAAVRSYTESGAFIPVDLYVDDIPVVAGVLPGEATSFREVPAGRKVVSVRPAEPTAIDTLRRPITLLHGEDYFLVLADALTDGTASPAVIWRPVLEAPRPGSVVLLGASAWSEPPLAVEHVADTPDHAVLGTLAAGASWDDLYDVFPPVAVNLRLRREGGPAYDTYRFDLAALEGRRIFLIGMPDPGDADRPLLRVVTGESGAIEGTVVTGTESVSPPAAFRLRGVFPNPTRGDATVVLDLPEAATVRVEVVDALGRVIRRASGRPLDSGAGRSLVLPLDGLAAGVYAYRVSVGDDARTRTASGTVLVVR